MPVPVVYKWRGSWEELQSGIVLLTWHGIDERSSYQWLHDHGIGMGELYSPNTRKEGNLAADVATDLVTDVADGLLVFSAASISTHNLSVTSVTPSAATEFEVTERMAMLPPADLPAGMYILEAIYLNRQTGESYPISVPTVSLKIELNADAKSAPELDLVTQLRSLAANLPKGADALESIFEQTGRINQYDPIQDYLVQADLALSYRLMLAPRNLDWAYALALSKVLQEDSQGAIAALKQVVRLDSQNPYAYAYLAFVYLYEWRGKDAQDTLKYALTLNPNLPELQALSGIASLMQGNVFKAWHFLDEFRRLNR